VSPSAYASTSTQLLKCRGTGAGAGAAAASPSPRDEHDNSSNVCFGERKPGASTDGKHDTGSAIWAGVPGAGAACTDAGFALGLCWGLMWLTGEVGTRKDNEAMGASQTSSRPLCGPAYADLMRGTCAGRTHAKGRLIRRGWGPAIVVGPVGYMHRGLVPVFPSRQCAQWECGRSSSAFASVLPVSYGNTCLYIHRLHVSPKAATKVQTKRKRGEESG
jgi:hypothetical protein